MTTPTPARLAEKLARTIHDDVATPLLRAKERAAGLRRPARHPQRSPIEPETRQRAPSASPSPSASEDLARHDRAPAGAAGASSPPSAGARSRSCSTSSRRSPRSTRRLPPPDARACSSSQPEVAHVYLGSRRAHDAAHLQRRERAVLAQRQAGRARRDRARALPPPTSAASSTAPAADRGAGGDRRRSSRRTGGHPYATQELCYFAWQETPPEQRCDEPSAWRPRWPRCCGSEHAHFSLLWDRASSVQRLRAGRAGATSRAARCRPTTGAATTCRGARRVPARGRGARARRARGARPRRRSGSSSRSSAAWLRRDAT